MFYGIEVKSGPNQAKPVILENAIKLTQAVYDLSKNGKREPVSLVAEYNKKEFVICNLDSTPGSWQCPLDLVFDAGSQLRFYLRGSGTVHLTGYETFNELDDMSMSMSSDEDDEVEVSDEEEVDSDNVEVEEVQPSVTTKMAKSSGKKVILPSPKAKPAGNMTNGKKTPAKIRAENDPAVRRLQLEAGNDDDDEDESDDEDFDADLDEEDDDEELDDEDIDDEDLEEYSDDDADIDEEMEDESDEE